jgi:hypothetical protein
LISECFPGCDKAVWSVLRGVFRDIIGWIAASFTAWNFFGSATIAGWRARELWDFTCENGVGCKMVLYMPLILHWIKRWFEKNGIQQFHIFVSFAKGLSVLD